jgi:hypothetical protein
LLLAALARINTVLSDLLPEVAQTSRPETENAQREPLADGFAGQDKGTVVSRQDLLAFRHVPAPAATPRVDPNPTPSTQPTSPLPKPDKKSKKSTKKTAKKKGDEWSSLFGNLE